METHGKRKQMSAAYRYSFSRLALNYYTFYETMYETAAIPEKIREASGEFHELLKGFLDGRKAAEQSAYLEQVSRLDGLRSRLIHTMEIITAYTDCFQIYEYVLNRIERRFTEQESAGQSVEDFTTALVETLMQSNDAVIMNSRIQEVMGQLPVRYTKQKFYSLLMERLTIYAGAGKSSLEDILYMLRTSAMVALPEDMEQEQEELYGLLEKLRHMDYRNMEKEQYETCTDCVFLASERLNQEAGIYLMLEDLINDLYVLFLTRNEALVDGVEDQTFRAIAEGILRQFQEGDGRVLPDEITELLERLEGIQESSMEHFLYQDRENRDGELAKIEKLLSGSSFVRLDEEEQEDEPADRQWIEEKGEEFCRELGTAFEGMPKAVVRAVMAKILSYLPVVFRTSQELKAYIQGSLESCTDFAEREACMEILTQELMNEDALV